MNILKQGRPKSEVVGSGHTLVAIPSALFGCLLDCKTKLFHVWDSYPNDSRCANFYGNAVNIKCYILLWTPNIALLKGLYSICIWYSELTRPAKLCTGPVVQTNYVVS